MKIVDGFKGKDVDADCRISKGSVVQSIIDTAAGEDMDLIALARYGRSGLLRTFYGSVSTGVLQKIDRPIRMGRSRQVNGSV